MIGLCDFGRFSRDQEFWVSGPTSFHPQSSFRSTLATLGMSSVPTWTNASGRFFKLVAHLSVKPAQYAQMGETLVETDDDDRSGRGGVGDKRCCGEGPVFDDILDSEDQNATQSQILDFCGSFDDITLSN